MTKCKAYLALLIATLVLSSSSLVLADGPCVGARHCTVCTDCSRCEYCSQQGNSCGVCAKPPAEPAKAGQDLYANALSILAIDQKVDLAIVKVTKQLSASEITLIEAQGFIEQLEDIYETEVFVLNRKEYFQARLRFAQVVAERHKEVIMSTISDPDGVLSDPVIRSRMPMVTFNNLFYDLSAAQMKRLQLLNEGLKLEIRSGLESARSTYSEQLGFAQKYKEARASIDRILLSPD